MLKDDDFTKRFILENKDDIVLEPSHTTIKDFNESRRNELISFLRGLMFFC